MRVRILSVPPGETLSCGAIVDRSPPLVAEWISLGYAERVAEDPEATMDALADVERAIESPARGRRGRRGA